MGSSLGPLDRRRILIHETFHWLWYSTYDLFTRHNYKEQGLPRDVSSSAYCTGTGSHGICYREHDAITLAYHDPDTALQNIDNFAGWIFSLDYWNYMQGGDRPGSKVAWVAPGEGVEEWVPYPGNASTSMLECDLGDMPGSRVAVCKYPLWLPGLTWWDEVDLVAAFHKHCE
jgi:hypothetical protein